MVATVYTNDGKAYTVGLQTTTDSIVQADYRIAWGTGGSSTGGTATATDDVLKAEATEVRATTQLTSATTTVANDTAQWIGTLTAETTKTIEEAGVFSTATGGTLFVRGNHGGIALATDDQIQYTITLQQT